MMGTLRALPLFPARSSLHVLFKGNKRLLLSTATDRDKQPVVVLYQYAICPFCNQVKAVFDYAGVNYESIEVNPLTKAEIKWSKDYRKVPIAKVNTEHVFGSNTIIERILERPEIRTKLEERWRSSPPGDMHLEKFSKSSSAMHWGVFASDELASLLYPNMCRTLRDSYDAFSYVGSVHTFGSLQRLAIRSIGSFAMYMAASKIKQKRNITDEQAALDEILIELETRGLENGGKAYLSGTSEPDLGDLAVFGTLRSVDGLPTHRKVVQERNGPILDWYRRMSEKALYRSSP